MIARRFKRSSSYMRRAPGLILVAILVLMASSDVHAQSCFGREPSPWVTYHGDGTISGTDFDDVIIGTDRAERIYGFDGDDTMYETFLTHVLAENHSLRYYLVDIISTLLKGARHLC